MKITIISGSTRENSQSRQVSNYLAKCLIKCEIENTILDLSEKRLPLYDATEEGPWKNMWGEMSDLLKQSDGFVFVSPEWDGMFSVGIHNLFHYVDREMADKPVLTIGVSSGSGGRYPLQQMRTMGYKNKRCVVIPESIFYDHITEHLVDGVFTDNRITERTDYALKVLAEYAKALSVVRESGVTDYEKFPNGL